MSPEACSSRASRPAPALIAPFPQQTEYDSAKDGEPHDVRATRVRVGLQIEAQEFAFGPLENRRHTAARRDVHAVAIDDRRR